MINSTVDQFLVLAVARLFLVFGIVGFAVGVGLILKPARMHQFFAITDRWFSMRRGTRWLAVPHDIEEPILKYRRPIGALFIVVAAVSTFVLLMSVDTRRVADALGGSAPHLYVAWLVESARRALVAGSVLAIAVGIMLVFFPRALRSVELRANKWYSVRAHGQTSDTMHMGFEHWIESHPQRMGGVIAAASLLVAFDYGTRLLAA